MEQLKRQVDEYCSIKNELKKLTERKNHLEKSICSIMEEFDVTTLELSDGHSLNYKVKETLTLSKDKTKSKKESKKGEE